MRNLLKFAGIGLLVVGLAACDGKTDGAADDNGVSSSQAGQNVSLLDGKLSFTLPAGMSDKTAKLGVQAGNKHVYADDSNRRTIIVMADENSTDGLDVLANRLEEQQRNRDPQLQVVTNKTITVNDQQLQQLDSVISAQHQSLWSTVVLAKINNQLVTVQIALPADDQQKAQSEAEGIVSSLAVK